MAKRADLHRGTQVIFVPYHVLGDVSHPDCEQGFTTGFGGTTAFCRFWRKHQPHTLTSKQRSTPVPMDCLVIKDTHPQGEVDAALQEYC